jgi:hypothetical protein
MDIIFQSFYRITLQIKVLTCASINFLQICVDVFWKISIIFKIFFPYISMGKNFGTIMGMHLKSILLSMEKNGMWILEFCTIWNLDD